MRFGAPATSVLGGASAAGRARWPWLVRSNIARLAYRIALVAFVLIGVYFRSRRYFFDPLGLWMDEAMWGIRLFTRPLTNLEFRPIGYMALTKLIVNVYCNEATLRSLSYLAGIGSLLVTVDLARLLFSSRWVRVLCVAVVAYQPLLIDMSREFKPYALEHFVHLALVWLFVRWRARSSPVRLTALLTCAVLAFPFAYNVVLLLPGLFGLLGFRLLRARAYWALSATVLAAAAALIMMATLYFSVLRGTTADGDGTAQFWGKKYDVFYLPSARLPELSRPGWIAQKYADLAAWPGSHGNKPPKADDAVSGVTRRLATLGRETWLLLHVVGLLALLLYRREQLLLLAGPLLVTLAFNAAKQWPFGAFRTNVFLLAYMVLISLVGLDALFTARFKLVRVVGALGGLILLVANLSAGFEPHIRKHFFSTETEMASIIGRMMAIREQQPIQRRTGRTAAFFDNATCTPFIFDARYNSTVKRQFGSVEDSIDIHCAPGSLQATGKLLKQFSKHGFFVVVGDDRHMAGYSRMLSRQSRVLVHEAVRGVEDLYYAVRR